MTQEPRQALLDYNREAWNEQVKKKNRWTQPVSSATIADARQGIWQIVLTPAKPVPADWFPDLKGCQVLCLASGGGQQGPTLAAAGAQVTVFDNSDKQLEQDLSVAKSENLSLETLQGDMADLKAIPDNRFDLIVHPCSNTFVPDVRPVWKEAHRVLKPGGNLLSGFCNPIIFIFDDQQNQKGILQVRHQIPYSDTLSLSDRERQKLVDAHEPFCFGHTLDDQIGGQIDAGFSITGFYEDYWSDENEPIDQYIASFIATKATKSSDL
ncbi:MAG: class I SAM-dependent methyltransferase [Planctomycetota bacterium]|jgi:ubiquinone/menaquinone biosynthesis C-methylase UbiE|nr:class I SAM-dependent methyltransferase [Planctomycetota bacterium]